MTSPTQAAALSPDPVMREAEIKALKDQIRVLRQDADALHIIGKTKLAITKDDYADRLQRRLDELENPHVHD